MLFKDLCWRNPRTKWLGVSSPETDHRRISQKLWLFPETEKQKTSIGWWCNNPSCRGFAKSIYGLTKWLITTYNPLGGWPTPLKNDGVRQLGWCLTFPTKWKNNIHVPNHQPQNFHQDHQRWAHTPRTLPRNFTRTPRTKSVERP